MLLSSMHKQMDILKVFRDSVIDRIHELGVDKMESRVDKSLSCENEKCLLHWGESNGVRTRLQIAGEFSIIVLFLSGWLYNFNPWNTY